MPPLSSSDMACGIVGTCCHSIDGMRVEGSHLTGDLGGCQHHLYDEETWSLQQHTVTHAVCPPAQIATKDLEYLHHATQSSSPGLPS